MQITPQQIAIAAQALNRHTAISDTARRVAQELLSATNRETGTAWPSEEGMAKALGLSDRSIRRAKAELRAHGLLTWFRRGTNRRGRTNVYQLSWDVLVSLGTRIKATLKAARAAATRRLRRPVTFFSKPRETAPRPAVDRTSSVLQSSPDDYSNHKRGKGLLNIASHAGFWKAPGTPQGQVFTDQQLDNGAYARISEALRHLGQSVLAQFYAHPNAEQLQAEAIRAERYSKAKNGSAGLAVIAARLREVTA